MKTETREYMNGKIHFNQEGNHSNRSEEFAWWDHAKESMVYTEDTRSEDQLLEDLGLLYIFKLFKYIIKETS